MGFHITKYFYILINHYLYNGEIQMTLEWIIIILTLVILVPLAHKAGRESVEVKVKDTSITYSIVVSMFEHLYLLGLKFPSSVTVEVKKGYELTYSYSLSKFRLEKSHSFTKKETRFRIYEEEVLLYNSGECNGYTNTKRVHPSNLTNAIEDICRLSLGIIEKDNSELVKKTKERLLERKKELNKDE